MNKGTCLCGDITWEVEDEFSMMINCHCSICRKVHGSAYGTFVTTAADRFRWTSGNDRIRFYESSKHGRRPFCPRCGSCVAEIMGEIAYMPAGNLEGDIDHPLDNHIFTDSRACWFEITDDAQQHGAYSPTYDGAPIVRPILEPETEGATGGSCACGKVAYEFDGPPDRMGYCHCSRCRKARSAAFSTQAFVATGKFRWIKGQDNVTDFKLPESQYFITTFCRDCGSPVAKAFEDFDMVMLPAGSLDQDPGLRPEAHIYVASKASWLDITDDLPQFEEMPPDW